MNTRFRRVVALSGGVGGARLVHGLAQVLDPGSLSVIVNTGDDFTHWGLHISPDLDTVMYTLAGQSHEERGWGLAEESFGALAMMRLYNEAAWFQLGDRDLGTHLARTASLARGETLTDITARLATALGVKVRLIPMADQPVRTILETRAHGALSFQEWLVQRGGPPPLSIHFEGTRSPSPAALDALRQADAVVIGPSNPYVSIDPILAMSGLREAMRGKPVVAVSPIVGGKAIKGPLADMIRSLAWCEASAGAVAEHYGKLLGGIVVERGDGASVRGMEFLETSTVMRSHDDRKRLALDALRLAESLA